MDADTVKKDMHEFMEKEFPGCGITVGSVVYVIRTGCYGCPEMDDHCQIGCTRKDVRYFEEVEITRIVAEGHTGRVRVILENPEKDVSCGLDDHGKTFFTEQDDAICYLAGCVREYGHMR